MSQLITLDQNGSTVRISDVHGTSMYEVNNVFTVADAMRDFMQSRVPPAFNRVCGELLDAHDQTYVCCVMYGVEHDHSMHNQEASHDVLGNAVNWPDWLRDPLADARKGE